MREVKILIINGVRYTVASIASIRPINRKDSSEGFIIKFLTGEEVQITDRQFYTIDELVYPFQTLNIDLVEL